MVVELRGSNLLFMEILFLVLGFVGTISVLGLIFCTPVGLVWYFVLRKEVESEQKKKNLKIAKRLIFLPFKMLVLVILLYAVASVVNAYLFMGVK